MTLTMRASDIRKSFLDFFFEQGHTLVPSASLVPGGDATLLFTNAGMVQFKDVFLGTDNRPYKRAADSQKCMRVAGKHNDLEDVGTDDTHHTFFEMLGNWSFGDYYKKEAIGWAWQLLTDVWKLPRERLYATCFRDEKGEIPADDEAATIWMSQPGMILEHVLFFGRKDNFWEMAETGPCGPCSEIHIDRGEEFCNLKSKTGHECKVNGDCQRFLELWNLVFIQYNRLNQNQLISLPATHVDTGMGFERIVSILQGVDSNYKTDLFTPAMDVIRSMTKASSEDMFANYTPYRVIADHCRAATFLIADGIVPGNTGRNYICRMIIRRAARFGSKIGLNEPFLSKVAEAFIESYKDFYPEVLKFQKSIIDNITREEIRFAKTVESGTAVLEGLLEQLRKDNKDILSGSDAFELYATYGLPLEITRDIALEKSLDVDEEGFRRAMDDHRIVSGAGTAMGEMGGEDAEFFSKVKDEFHNQGLLGIDGVIHDPYKSELIQAEVLGIFKDGKKVDEAFPGDQISVLVSKTCFYVESGGQVSDIGKISSSEKNWEINISGVRKPSPGMIIHIGKVIFGNPKINDEVNVIIDSNWRMDIRRNHTATHLLHAELRRVLGEKAQQAGSLVSPDRLRFDFNHHEALTQSQLDEIEYGVNQAILFDMNVRTEINSLDSAISGGATALFGEKYGENVRTIRIINERLGTIPLGDYSYELCGGTHMDRTGNIGTFLILGESSVASGVRRIEAITGKSSYEFIANRIREFRKLSRTYSVNPVDIYEKVNSINEELELSKNLINEMKSKSIIEKFKLDLNQAIKIGDSYISIQSIDDVDAGVLRQLCDIFKEKYSSGIVIVGTIRNSRPMVIVSTTNDFIVRGIDSVSLVKHISEKLEGSGGGKPSLAQAGGKDPSKLDLSLRSVRDLILEKLN